MSLNLNSGSSSAPRKTMTHDQVGGKTEDETKLLDEFRSFNGTSSPQPDWESCEKCCQGENFEQKRYRCIPIKNINIKDEWKAGRIQSGLDSIQRNEFIPPLLDLNEEGKFDIRDGIHRVLACQKLKYDDIVCSIQVPFESNPSNAQKVCSNFQNGQCNCECRAQRLAKGIVRCVPTVDQISPCPIGTTRPGKWN
jgi:hypothetical protein